MSSGKPTSLTKAALFFLAWFTGLTALWAALAERYYDPLIIELSRIVLATIEGDPMTGTIELQGFDALVSHRGRAAAIPAQRLELRTHENNTPLLLALILATPWLPWRGRLKTALVALPLLCATHVFHFTISVHWLYAWENVGPYRVTDLSYLNKTFLESLDNPAQVRKYIVNYTYHFYTHVGRLLMPILLWMVFAATPPRRQGPGGLGEKRHP